MAKPDDIDCLEMKRRVQRPLSKKLSGKSANEQSQVLNSLAARSSLWKRLAGAKPARAEKPVRQVRRKRSSG